MKLRHRILFWGILFPAAAFILAYPLGDVLGFSVILLLLPVLPLYSLAGIVTQSECFKIVFFNNPPCSLSVDERHLISLIIFVVTYFLIGALVGLIVHKIKERRKATG
jgi:Mn2+/Fe2+ NRAMP family transporter